MGDETFITATGPLTAANAVAAILVLDDGRYVMQLRDPLPSIFYPGHWGCFGGAVDRGENPKQTLIRELREELELEVTMANEFTRFDFDLRKVGQERVYRITSKFRSVRQPSHSSCSMRGRDSALFRRPTSCCSRASRRMTLSQSGSTAIGNVSVLEAAQAIWHRAETE